MKAMILAAGLGTRLRPLTDTRPKALVEVSGRPLLEITLSRLSSFGVHDVIINVHHFPDMILDYLKAHDNFGLHIEISREEQLLDTGGGLKKASWFFLQDSAHSEEPFILHNVDVISTIDLHRMAEFHNAKQALATLAVQHRNSLRQLLFDVDLRLCGRRASFDQEPELVRGYPLNPPQEATDSVPAQKANGVIPRASDEDARRTSTSNVSPTSRLHASDKRTQITSQSHCADTLQESTAQPVPCPAEAGMPIRMEREGTASAVPNSAANSRALAPEVSLQPFAFTGIHIISPRLLRLMPEQGVFSIIDTYLHLCAHGENILAFLTDDAYWRDLGKPADLAQAARDRTIK
jgi:NDP-sugar pyrophosphorylase family protein